MTDKEVVIIMPPGSDQIDLDRIRDAVRVASGYSVVTVDDLADRSAIIDEQRLKKIVDSGLNRLRPQLTDEEHSVLTRFVDGDRNRTIAKELKLPVQRVSAALLTVQRKLGVDNRVDLLRVVVTPPQSLNAN